MIIQSIYIKSFGKLEDVRMTFDERMNIIEGPNESGKSTLAAFIRYMLYGFPSARGQSGELTERARRVNWNRQAVGGTMTVLVGGKSYRIERMTAVISSGTRDTYRESNSILDATTGSPVYAGKNAGEVFLGVPESVFLNTAFIGQVGGPAVGSGEMNDAIENLLFSGDESINTKYAQDKLDEASRSLLHKNGKGGEIFDLRAKRDALSIRLEEAKRDNREILAREVKLSDAASKRSAAEDERSKLERIRELYHTSQTLREFDRLHELEARCAESERECDEFRRSEGYGDFFPDDDYTTHLAVLRRALADSGENYRSASAERDRAYAQSDIGADAKELIETVEREGGCEKIAATDLSLATSPAKKKKAGVTMLLPGLAALVGGGVTAAMSLLSGIPLYVLLAVGAVLAVIGAAILTSASRASARVRQYRETFGVASHEELLALLEKYRHVKADDERRKNDFSALSDGAARAQRSYNDTVREFVNEAARWGYDLPENVDYSALAEELHRRSSEVCRRSLELRAHTVSLENKIDELRSRLSQYDEDELRRTLPDSVRATLDSADMDEINKRADFYTGQVKGLDDVIRATERELYELRARAQDPAQLSAQLDELNTRISALEEKHAAYLLASEALSGAGERLRGEVSPRLAEYASAVIGKATENKYGNIGVSGALDITFTGDDGTKSVAYLSTGTQDLTYVALRMALIDLLYRELPPVMFDETFAHQDDRRAAAMMHAICSMSEKGHQNIIFTCHGREARLAREDYPDVRVIEMPAN